MVSVNTATTHIAAAVQTPVIVLYAETNPQHTPWKVANKVFTFPVAGDLCSKNEVLRYASEKFFIQGSGVANVNEVSEAVLKMMTSR